MYEKVHFFSSCFVRDEKGVTAVEYSIVACAISVIVLGIFNGELQTALSGAMTSISNNISTAASVKGGLVSPPLTP